MREHVLWFKLLSVDLLACFGIFGALVTMNMIMIQ
jgi:hypothetical protein